MTKDHDFKRHVRERAARTGESYQAAWRHLSKDTQSNTRHARDVAAVDWLEQLARAEGVEEEATVRHHMRTLPEQDLRSVAIAGLRHPVWTVRRACAQLLDDLPLTPTAVEALTLALDDEEGRVRKAAFHTLTCAHCKPDKCTVDLQSIFERMKTDPYRGVRKMVITACPSAAWGDDLLRWMAANDPSTVLRNLATDSAFGFRARDERRMSDAARRRLPDALREQTERHRGKWVAVAHGRVIAVSGAGSVHRAARSSTDPEAAVYWVALEPE